LKSPLLLLALLGCDAFPRGGRCGQACLLPSLSYGLQWSDEGTEHLDRCFPIPYTIVGGVSFQGVCGPWDGIFDVVLIIQVPKRLSLMWRSPLLPGCTYPLLELSWRLCVFPL
jgi:hypothetical protein